MEYLINMESKNILVSFIIWSIVFLAFAFFKDSSAGDVIFRFCFTYALWLGITFYKINKK